MKYMTSSIPGALVIIKACLKSDTLSGSGIYLLICNHRSYRAANLYDWLKIRIQALLNRFTSYLFFPHFSLHNKPPSCTHCIQAPWMRSIDENKNTKYLSRIFGWGKHCAIWRKTWKTVVNYDLLWSIPTALVSPLHSVLTASREDCFREKGLCSHLCGFAGK